MQICCERWVHILEILWYVEHSTLIRIDEMDKEKIALLNCMQSVLQYSIMCIYSRC